MITEARRAYNRALYLRTRAQALENAAAYRGTHRDAIRIKARENYYRNREKILLQKRIYAQRTTEHKSQYSKQYRLKNAEKLKAGEKRWRANNRQRINAANRAYWKKHPEKFKAWKRNWVGKNRGKVNAYDAKRNAQELAATVDAVAAQWFYEIVHNQDVLTCAYCSKTIAPKHAHVDHIIPVSRGGEHGPHNFCVACSTCNQSKSDDMLHEWKKLPERVKPLLEFI